MNREYVEPDVYVSRDRLGVPCLPIRFITLSFDICEIPRCSNS